MERDEVEQAIKKGISRANTTYERWTKDWGLADYGVESLMAVKIAQAIHPTLRPNRESLTMETTYREMEGQAGVKRKCGPKHPYDPEPGERIDIVLWHTDETLCWVIEVKREWANDTCRADLMRLARTLAISYMENEEAGR